MGKTRDLFAKLFSLGLLFLFADVFKRAFPPFLQFDFFDLDRIPFFVIGVTVCLVSLLFLLTEWVMLPYGTQIKRIKLYQGTGNIFAFAILVFGCLSENSAAQTVEGRTSMAFSVTGLFVAIVFAWLGKPLARFYSRKHIKLESLVTSRSLHLAENAQ